MGDEYQLRKDVDKIYGDIYNLQNKELSIYTKEQINDILDDKYYDISKINEIASEKQDVLVSGTNIKTINDNSILGSGNITIQGGGGGGNYINDYYWDSTTEEIILDYDSSGGGGGGGSSVDIVTSWSSTTSDSKVPSEKLTKDTLDDKISKSNTSGLVRSDGSIDTNTYLTSHQSLTNYIQKSNTSGLIKNDGTIDTNTYLTSHQSLSNYIQKSNTSGLIKNDGTVDTNTYLTSHQSLTNYVQKSETSGLIKNDGTIDTNTYLTSHQSLSGYLQTSDVVDNLSSTSTTAPLSAKQGKELNDMIGSAITYITGSGS